jgi:2,3-dihydroxy-p-cumate/2,3-dihydroxybenzoate 3,4-dioxygenase
MSDPITIEQVRYVRLGTADINGAADFAERILGLQLVERSETAAYFRSDHRDHTLVYVDGLDAGQSIGLEVRDPEGLDHAERALKGAGLQVGRGDAEACVARKVRQFLWFPTPAGYRIELVVRPLHSGRRYHGPRDAGITGLEAVALRGAPDGSDQLIWTRLLGGRVSDWVGDAAYIRFDEAHHRIAVHPSEGKGVLAVEFGVEDVDRIMQNAYHMRAAQVRIVGGPGRRPTSQQLFLVLAGPDGVNFSYVAEGERQGVPRRARQFPRKRESFCAWGSDTEIAEYQ